MGRGKRSSLLGVVSAAGPQSYLIDHSVTPDGHSVLQFSNEIEFSSPTNLHEPPNSILIPRLSYCC